MRFLGVPRSCEVRFLAYGLQKGEDMIQTQNEDVNYIIECAESVGITIDDKTPLNNALIAEIMRKLRNQPKVVSIEEARL